MVSNSLTSYVFWLCFIILQSAKVGKRDISACISWVGGMVRSSLTTYVLWLCFRRKNSQWSGWP